jgi:hypothetical protein
MSAQIMLAPHTHAMEGLVSVMLLDHREIHTDAADTCHYPSSDIVIGNHLGGSWLPRAAHGLNNW